MNNSSLYYTKEPSVWSESPDLFSFSSLSTIDMCPLQWQLVHSTYGDLCPFPTRPNPSAVEGDIVHHVLDELFKELAFVGLPKLGSNDFREAITKMDISDKVEDLIAGHEERVSKHPRGGGFRVRIGTQQIVNRIIRLFRSEYPKASSSAPSTPRPVSMSSIGPGAQLLPLIREKGALSEVRLVHPSLPFTGIIDLVRIADNNISIVDFKTGAPKASHREQVLYYAVLWWRNTGAAPKHIEVRYLGKTEAVLIEEKMLADSERDLVRRINQLSTLLSCPPAAPRLGDHCQYCDVRQFCASYWENRNDNALTAKGKTKTVDIELVVKGHPGSNGFLAETSNGTPCSVVYSPDGVKVHGPFFVGETLRVLNARVAEPDKAVEFMPWTEVFHR